MLPGINQLRAAKEEGAIEQLQTLQTGLLQKIAQSVEALEQIRAEPPAGDADAAISQAEQMQNVSTMEIDLQEQKNMLREVQFELDRKNKIIQSIDNAERDAGERRKKEQTDQQQQDLAANMQLAMGSVNQMRLHQQDFMDKQRRQSGAYAERMDRLGRDVAELGQTIATMNREEEIAMQMKPPEFREEEEREPLARYAGGEPVPEEELANMGSRPVAPRPVAPVTELDDDDDVRIRFIKSMTLAELRRYYVSNTTPADRKGTGWSKLRKAELQELVFNQDI